MGRVTIFHRTLLEKVQTFIKWAHLKAETLLKCTVSHKSDKTTVF